MIVLFAMLAQANPPPPPRDSVNRFHLSVANGAITGTEEYRFERTAGGRRLIGTSHIQRPNGTLDATQVQTFAPRWAFDHYRLDVTVATGPQVLEAYRVGDSVQIQASAGERGQTRRVPLAPRTLVLDNLVVSHYQVLIDLFNATPGPERGLQWQFIVPQVVTAVRGTVGVEDGPAGLRKYSIDVAGTLVEVYADAATNRLMRVAVPLQRVEIVREGFTMPPSTPTPPVGPAAFSEREVTFPSADLTFLGTLCLPAHPGARVPIVVLVHGSGPNDRDETIGPNKPFRDIAHALASAGIATLRYDKRTFAFGRQSDWRTFTVDQEVIDDAVAAARFARTLPEVDSARVFLLGHSLGGTLAPLIAARLDAAPAGLILLAPGARPLDDAILTQMTLRLRLTGRPEDEIASQVNELKAAFTRVRAGAAADTEIVFGAPARYWRDLWSRTPLATLRDLPQPVLLLQGGADYQVTKDDYELVQQALAARPAAARESHWFPDLNHLLVHVDGPSTGSEYGREGHVDPRVTDAIAAWIGARSR